MSRPVDLPSEGAIRDALHRLTDEAGGATPPVTALARELGLSNSTFWRRFPDIAQKVADGRRQAARTQAATAGNRTDTPARVVEARLRAQIIDLTAQIQTAAVQVQRLTLENHTLREHLTAQDNIARIPRWDRFD
ncbi:hypothetical protein GCM10009816_24000 [Microbacterium aquimaris]